FLVAEQLRQLEPTPSATILEPCGRNTAPAIALAAHAALAQRDGGGEAPDPVLLVLPADHVIRDVPAFQQAVRTALGAAESGQLVTFGVVARSPETAYGYIQRGAPSGAAFRIARFVEKPDERRAREFVKAGDYYWNSGMFMFRARRYLEELERFAPDMARVCATAFRSATADLDFTRIDAAAFEPCPADSIDYAVMEKPDERRAREFVKAGDYYWNSGMFMFRARRYLEELERFAPDMARVCATAFRSATADLDFTRIDAAAFEPCPADSIDYAVMEKTNDAVGG